MTIRMVSASKLTKIASASNPIVAVFFLAVGYYLGSQHALIVSYNNSSSSSSSSSSTGFIHSQVPPSKSFATSKNQAADTAPSKLFATSKNYQVANINTTGDGTKDASAFRLHPHIELSEDPGLFRKIVYPLVRKLVESGEVTNCPLAPVKPYLDILKNIEESPSYYEDSNVKNSNQTCPVVFLFYFEGGSGMAETFFDFYSNIRTKRCLNFIVSSRWKDHEQTKKIEDNGYTIVGASYPEQTQTISMSLDEIKKQYGDDVLVSVNDLDHLLVWFDLAGKPHRYSIYTEMVKLYAYELLSTRGCSNQNVHEKYVVPCTCLMEKNEKYISTTEDGVVWSEYGVTNRFHPTANFYLNKSLETKAEKSPYAYSVGTVFANLRLYERDIVVHHKIGWRSKKVFSRARMCGVIHARSDNMIQSLAKYHHFLMAMHQNVYRNKKATIADAMSCAVVDTRDIIANIKACRSVKELANILAIGHQKKACLNAGYSEDHCISDISCCLTY